MSEKKATKVKVKDITLPINQEQADFVPVDAKEIVGEEDNLRTLALSVRENLPTLIIGETGCLHPDTPIYDPVDNTTISVKERYSENKNFHVLSIDDDNNIVIAKADAPKKYTKTSMYKLVFDDGEEITVTGLHKFWNGNCYVTAESLYSSYSQSEQILLPSILEHDLSALLEDARHLIEKHEGSQDDCHLLSRLCGQPLHVLQDIDLSVSQQQGGAQEQFRSSENLDAQEDIQEYNHQHLSDDLRSSDDSSRQSDKNLDHESQPQVQEDTSLESPVSHQSEEKPDAYLNQTDTNQPLSESSLESISLPLFNGNTDGRLRQVVSITKVEDEVYYDFHVPIYNNYWACGVFNHNTGKTSIVRYLAKITGNGFRRLNLDGGTTTDEFVGRLIPDPKTKSWKWTDGVLVDAMRKGHWLLVDEVNAAVPEILFVLHSLLDDDGYVVLKGHDDEVVRPHPNFRFFATMNPSHSYAGTKELNKAFLSRFGIVVEFETPKPEKEKEIILSHYPNVKDKFVTRMIDVAGQIRKSYEEGESDFYISVRDLLHCFGIYQTEVDEMSPQNEKEELKLLARAFKVSVFNKTQGDKDTQQAVQVIYESKFGAMDEENVPDALELRADVDWRECIDQLQTAASVVESTRQRVKSVVDAGNTDMEVNQELADELQKSVDLLTSTAFAAHRVENSKEDEIVTPF